MTEKWNCLPLDLIVLNVALACVDGILAVIAFAQLVRIHMRSQQNGWTRQKVLHFMVGSSNLASPKILFLAAYLLLLSFWVDLCHQANEEEEDNDENGIQQALLEDLKREPGSVHMKEHQRCCSFQGIHVGSRQRYVIMILVLIFVVMMSFATLIWIGVGKNSINPLVVAQVYEKFLAVMILILAGALGCYGLLLFFKLRKVRSEKASSEMWKLLYYSHLKIIYRVKAFVFLIFYYFVGCSLPSAYLLWIIRELPPPMADHSQEQPRTFTFISHGASNTNQPQCWATATVLTNQGSRASPI